MLRTELNSVDRSTICTLLLTMTMSLTIAMSLMMATSATAQVGVRLYGKVTDAGGSPVEGAEVEITVWEEGSKQTVRVETDTKGRYRAVMMHNSRSYRFVITKDGFKTLDHLEEPGLKRTSFNAPISKDFRLTSGYEVASGNDSNDGSGALGAGKGPEAYNLGVKALEDDDLENAKFAFLEAVEDSPGFALAHAALASVLCELEDFEEAVVAAKKAVALEADVRSLEILHRAGRGGEDDEAIGLALQGLAERRPDKTTARMFYNDGVTAFEAEVYDRAELRFRTALEIEPGLREAGRALGRVYLKQGKYQEAKAEAERLVEVDRYDLEALDVLQRARDALLDEG